MAVGTVGDDVDTACLEGTSENPGIFQNLFDIGFELGLERFTERNRLGRDDVHQRAALQAGEYGRIDLLAEIGVIGQDHTTAWTTQGLVGGGSDDMGVWQR